MNRWTKVGKWGFAGPWYGELTAHTGHVQMDRLHMLREKGFEVFSAGLSDLMQLPEAERRELLAQLDACGMELAVYAGYPYITADADEVAARNEQILSSLAALCELKKPAIVMTHAHYTSRFDKRFPLDVALKRLSAALAPLAAGCKELGTKLALENHADFYCSDLVTVCLNTPDLWIFLDTGNTFLIGERPLEAFQAAAPYVIGTHFKDHQVRPVLDANPLYFEVDGSVLGEGDVPLQDCYELLLAHAPFPEELIMEIEMVCPAGVSPIEALEKSITYIQSLDGDGE
ncbi:sugar phosphate isomerase/epimerase [Paenibacillus taihuensis]|uniref:Sugar phosphate isomerase/epimerase n=1 Tax=Paenibacillus taihuensis TaxID=1156355 RepID=A0A3D9Q471_9BACL|nr:TIM barrel protein [Paenibacillus taihuensis]REE57442.1 sugar phosphate isomerase/epimerase [Paenibacillus taihuensis]